MARGERGIPLAAVERIIKKVGEKHGITRVSDKAVRLLKQYLEEIAQEIAGEAVALATHAKRTTIKREDIKLAAKAKVKALQA
ncbi:MAG TPA: histone [Candidatus Nanopusillus sp.]|nr:histone [Candidatus Nanopusillus sp.]HIP90391.1 histone [Candidatus Nanopusillus sp.]